MSISVRQIKAARALLGWSQEQLAQASGVSYPTIARLESADGEIGGRGDAAQKIVAALEAANIEFTNGGQPGVRLSLTGATTTIEPLEIVSSSQLSVRMRTSDGGSPVVIVVERNALDDYFRLPTSTSEYRRQIVERNLSAFAEVTIERLARRSWTEVSGSSGRYRQIVVRLQDLEGLSLQLP